jgi:hypothetical protein
MGAIELEAVRKMKKICALFTDRIDNALDACLHFSTLDNA